MSKLKPTQCTVKIKMFAKNPKPESSRRRPSVDRGAAVFSYHANRSAQAGSQVRVDEATRTAAAARRLQRLSWLKRGPTVALAVVVTLLGVFNLFLGGEASIVTVGDARGIIFLRSQEIYTQAAHEVLGASVFNKTKVTINSQSIAKELQARFPELESVKVSLPLVGRQPTVYIAPASPKLLLAAADGGTFVVDAAGRAMIAANQVTHLEKLKLPVVSDQSGLSVKPGTGVLPSTSVSFITEVVGQLQAKELQIVSLTLLAGSSELDVRLDGVGYLVKFNLQGNARAEAGAFLAVKQQLEREHKAPSSYVDVRVDDRAYYR